MVLIRTAYSEPVRVQYDDDTPSMTIQSAKDECDINKILAKYLRTRLLDHVRENQGQYGDFTSVQDYHASVQQVREADEMFNSLPSDLRKRFSNDPGSFLSFVGDEANRDEAMELGLIPKPVVEEDKPLSSSNEPSES